MLAKLEMLLALAKEQHFGRAAHSLGITQPTLSAGIRQLEEQLGVKLVQRGSRFGGLTPEGQRALVWARQIVGDSRRLRDEMRFSKEGLSGHLRLAAIPTALTWAARLTSHFTEKHPNVSFTVLSRSSIDILAMLENLDIDAGITYLDNEPLGRVAAASLYRERYVVICPADHALAIRRRLTWSDLSGVRLCLLTPDMQNRRIINRNFMEAGVEPAALVESNSTIVLVSHVVEGGFATILPTDLARFLAVGRDLALVPVADGAFVPTVGLVALHHEPYTPVFEALQKMARSIADPS
ncbi:DNA-binding transcriptional LysR family regulator [Rhodobium orientis]|uniref:LysR family transcriptional regulator n=1 Tax=Rhodobium orientis TaxID=34017 RepID=A0A327JK93_9HYPH|nr:LysR family transcriptional regulator [Rhodobium orientis]MBB4301336.1 DNA-binding transcriptional LysR family regulator [Rhodobium orientis]MBK5951076.1 LysR family transcriptional regulator [Rhodobium orientis]RAI26860.1 LysR family transcriptional regulator [Rhodobium orientis]